MRVAEVGDVVQQDTGAVAELPWRRWVVLYAGFTGAAVLALALPAPALGWRVLILVAAFHLALVWLARTTADDALWRAWTILAPLSVLMVLPDWFLADVLGSITFADTGGPFIGAVALAMAGMWTIALMPVVLLGLVVDRRAGLAAGSVAAAAAGLAVFVGAEVAAPLIPLWAPVEVAMTAGLATYVVVPELVLSVLAFLLVRFAPHLPGWAVAGGVLLIPFTYTGLLAVSFQFFG